LLENNAANSDGITSSSVLVSVGAGGGGGGGGALLEVVVGLLEAVEVFEAGFLLITVVGKCGGACGREL
jgi:hypothetical protein